MAMNFQTITQSSKEYPKLLKEISDAPTQLHVRGNIELLSHPNMLAVVGSRKAGTYGKQAIEKILPPVIKAGTPIVSGLAYGIDALAHKACVELKAPTIAVLGTGIDQIYPTSHNKLAEDILKHGGAIISEYDPGTPGSKHRFPERNRIVAGLCKATLIVQAAERSGSLITARLATESNRDVAVIPGQITDPLSMGTNRLLYDGATPILNAEDLLNLLGIDPEEEQQKQLTLNESALTGRQKVLIKYINHEPQHIDQITELAKMKPEKVSTLLLQLELADIIQNVGGMKYVRKN